MFFTAFIPMVGRQEGRIGQKSLASTSPKLNLDTAKTVVNCGKTDQLKKTGSDSSYSSSVFT